MSNPQKWRKDAQTHFDTYEAAQKFVALVGPPFPRVRIRKRAEGFDVVVYKPVEAP